MEFHQLRSSMVILQKERRVQNCLWEISGASFNFITDLWVCFKIDILDCDACKLPKLFFFFFFNHRVSCINTSLVINTIYHTINTMHYTINTARAEFFFGQNYLTSWGQILFVHGFIIIFLTISFLVSGMWTHQSGTTQTSGSLKFKEYKRTNRKTWPCLGGGDSSVVRAPDSWLKGRGFESLLERRENFLLQGRLSVLTLISVSVPPPCYHSST